MNNTNVPKLTTIYTIGHSNHTDKAFLALLQQHAIGCLVDVRSQPYSRYNPQFNRETLIKSLQTAGIHYLHMGDTLGGRPEQRDLYDAGETRPNYSRQRQTELYQQGLHQLIKLVQQTTVAIMCSEGNPHECHRQWLITPDLLDSDITVLHIHPNGNLETAEKTLEQLGFGF
ncbi:MAG: DUF488 domain-containing protein [Caldilineaceae bacterium]|nr:DUF488 domain-containing protein [Caldilineaceae bacterium]